MLYVKDIDTENKKVSLGYKKAEDNPWEKFKGRISHRQRVQGTRGVHHQVRRICAHPAGIDGLVHISEISNERVEKVSDV